MSKHFEPTVGASDEWYTPKYVFDALGETFDLDVAAPADPTHVHTPASTFIHTDSLSVPWFGFVWMNPPFGGRNGLVPWLEKWVSHGAGIALTPDRSSAGWWQYAAHEATSLLQVGHKVKFVRPDGTRGDKPTNGTTLFAIGDRADAALARAARKGLGWHSLVRKEEVA